MPILSSACLSPSPLPGPAFLQRVGGQRQGGGAKGLLTDGPGVRRLCEVLGHLPIDVKPAESKADGVRRAQGTGARQWGEQCWLGSPTGQQWPSFPEPAPPRGLKDPPAPSPPSSQLISPRQMAGPPHMAMALGWSCPHQSVPLARAGTPSVLSQLHPGLSLAWAWGTARPQQASGNKLSPSADAQGTGECSLSCVL